MSTLRPVSSLLFTTAFLLAGHGLHMTFLPLRASELGLSQTLIGLSGSAYFAGFLTGALMIPPIIARVGHIRSFTALLAIFLSSFLFLSLVDEGIFWVLVRFVLGAVMCGSYTVIESWLAEQSDSSRHGRVLSVYTAIVLISMAVGQYLLGLTEANPLYPFILVSLLVGLAIVPVSLTRTLAPAPVPATRLLFQTVSPLRTAFAGALGSGVVMGSFWGLGAIYALAQTKDPSFVPAFIAANIIGGALAQYPIGMASDRVDRRYVLAALCAASGASAFGLMLATSPEELLLGSFAFGAFANSLYAVSLAKAADNSKREEFVTIGSSVLLLNALGSASAALVVGWAMRSLGDGALFAFVGVASLVTGVFIILQPPGRTAVTIDEQGAFIPATSAMAPAAFDQDPRSDEEVEYEPVAPVDGELDAPLEFTETEFPKVAA
ncbi:MAG: MFS transporter [Halieaceae bacterium]|nr:MAG: MFS transporter [Halieaceae bacterium]